MARKIFAATVILLVAASLAFGENPKEGKPRAPASVQDRKNVHRLDEVRITGSAEHPAVLFFLPRAKLRLHPVRERDVGKESVLREVRGTGEFP